MNNKRGFFPVLTLGMVIALIVGILFLVLGIGFFINMNKFLLIGAAIVVLTLIFGFKGDFNKTKGKYMMFFLLIGVMFIASSSLLVQNSFVSNDQIEYVDDPQIGMIEYKIYTPTIWDKIFSVFKVQQSAFGTTSLKVGEQTTIYDQIPAKIGNQFVGKVVFGIYKDNSRLGVYTPDYRNDGITNKRVSMTFYAQQAGKYRGVTELYLCPTTSYALSSCSMSSYSGGVSINELTITDTVTPPTCSKKSGWTSWANFASIDNGNVQRRAYETVDSVSCTVSITSTELKTICSSGYVIEGTSSSTSGSGSKNCVIKEEIITPPLPPPPVDDEDEIILETCFDGTRNQDEVGIDCGGSMCSVCSVSKTPGYILENNKCQSVDDKAQYSTKEACEKDIIIEDSTEKGIDWFFQKYGVYFAIGFGFFMLIMIMLIVKNLMSRRK